MEPDHFSLFGLPTRMLRNNLGGSPLSILWIDLQYEFDVSMKLLTFPYFAAFIFYLLFFILSLLLFYFTHLFKPPKTYF